MPEGGEGRQRTKIGEKVVKLQTFENEEDSRQYNEFVRQLFGRFSSRLNNTYCYIDRQLVDSSFYIDFFSRLGEFTSQTGQRLVRGEISLLDAKAAVESFFESRGEVPLPEEKVAPQDARVKSHIFRERGGLKGDSVAVRRKVFQGRPMSEWPVGYKNDIPYSFVSLESWREGVENWAERKLSYEDLKTMKVSFANRRLTIYGPDYILAIQPGVANEILYSITFSRPIGSVTPRMFLPATQDMLSLYQEITLRNVA